MTIGEWTRPNPSNSPAPAQHRRKLVLCRRDWPATRKTLGLNGDGIEVERRSVQWGLGENRASDKPGPPIATVTPPNEATSDEQTPHRRKRRRILPKGKLIFAALALLPL